MSKILRQLSWIFFVLFVASCSGGGCSSCAGGALQPIHGEFPLTPEHRIPHSIQVRLTDQGLHAVEAIAPDLFGSLISNGFDIPRTDNVFSCLLDHVTLCPSGHCHINVSLAPAPARGLELGFVAPDQIGAHIRLVIQTQGPDHIGISGCALGGHIQIDTTQGSHPFVGLQTNIRISNDTHAERLHYDRVDLVSPTGSGDTIQQVSGEEIEDADINFSGGFLSWLLNALRGVLLPQLTGQLNSALGPLTSALAATSTPDPPGCPTGTTATSDGHCNFPDGTQVPMFLGTAGAGNFGALLGSITPGLRAPGSYVIAAGDFNHGVEVSTATGSTGMTVNVLGAVVSGQHNACVPRITPPATPTIPEFMTLRQNTIPGTTTTTDLGIGIAEDFLNDSMFNLWDSGMFCLGVTTHMSQQISTGLFTALPPLAGLRNITFPARSAPAALVLRPQQPPHITIGRGTDVNTDPLMRIAFNRLAIDFYAWSEERYVRFMTVNTDLTLPINLMNDMGGLRPVIGMASTANTTVVPATTLLTSNPTQIASVLDALLGTAIGMFAGNINPIALPSIPLPSSGGMSAGTVNIQIPMSGIAGVSDGGSRYLGLFANLQYMSASGHMDSIELDTTAQLERLPFDARVYELGPTFNVNQLPRVRLRLGTPNSFGHPVEYTYRVDNLGWSLWTRESTVEVQSPAFLAQGTHHIEVRARVADEPLTVDRDPARVDFTIDTVAPTVDATREGNVLVLHGHDEVSPTERLEYSVSFDGQGSDGAYSNNARVQIPDGAARVVLHVRDQSGNVGSSTINVPILETIRGGPSTDGSGCGCSTPGANPQGSRGLAALVAAALAALALARRRAASRLAPASRRTRAASPRGIGAFLWVIPLFFVALGCDCSGRPHTGDAGVTDAAVQCDGGGTFCRGMNRCVPDTTCTCPAGQQAMGMPALDQSTCTWDTSATACNCQPLPPLAEGMVGSYLDMAVAQDNTVWLSAYSPGDPATQRIYGDLIAGIYNHTSNTVNWTIVDGAPTTGTPAGDPSGWRGGIADPGDDVGRWSSIAVDAMGHPRIAYWDTTHDQLKFASYDGTAWHVSVVDRTGHNGRYASLVLLTGGVPAVAYRATLPDPMMAGHIQARVRYAKANNANPTGPTDWTITDVASAETSCRASDCPTGQACVSSTGQCAATTTTCSPACSATQACVAGACTDVYTSTWLEDFPPGIGLFCSLALDSMGRPQLVYYDRDRGNLMGASATSDTAWGAPFIIDGEAMMHDGGDRGAWASLVVGSDNSWHVGYVDAYNEQVLYAHVAGGALAGAPEVVDDGNGVGTTPFEDGHHIVGDSIQIDLDTSGALRMVYQDSSAGTQHLATRGTMGWTVALQDMMGHTGYWSRIERGNVATFWRDLAMHHYGVRVQQVH